MKDTSRVFSDKLNAVYTYEDFSDAHLKFIYNANTTSILKTQPPLAGILKFPQTDQDHICSLFLWFAYFVNFIWLPAYNIAPFVTCHFPWAWFMVSISTHSIFLNNNPSYLFIPELGVWVVSILCLLPIVHLWSFMPKFYVVYGNKFYFLRCLYWGWATLVVLRFCSWGSTHTQGSVYGAGDQIRVAGDQIRVYLCKTSSLITVLSFWSFFGIDA